MDLKVWQKRTAEKALSLRGAGANAAQRLNSSVARGLNATACVAGEAYTAALDWKNNAEFSNWLADQFSNQSATIASKAMDAEYLRNYVGVAGIDSMMVDIVLPAAGMRSARRCPI